MLESIHLQNVGPAAEMKLDFSPRLNLITGDNGLGKSFLLDIAWWALTRTWAREMVIPQPAAKAQIAYSYTTKSRGLYWFTSRYEPGATRWTSKHDRPPIPGIVLYAQVDGGFSVWDPMRNHWPEDGVDRPKAFLFTPDEVWKGNDYCKGVLDDWTLWQAGNNVAFQVLTRVLETLSPSPEEQLIPGPLRTLRVNDKGPSPTLRMPYGEDVALVHASAGMRRVIALAYLLTWTWQRHVEAAKILEQEPAQEVVFLIDEVEGHLHPQWQRRIVPALLKVIGALTGAAAARVQLITATHSPLVLASVESVFDANRDAWFDLDLEERRTVLRKRPYVRHGEVGNWLVSDAFDLKEPRSLEGEEAIVAAQAVLDAQEPSADAIVQADSALRKAGLPDIDPFWVRWGYFLERHKKSQLRVGPKLSKNGTGKRAPEP